MYQNTHYVVIAVTAIAKRLLRPQWWPHRAGCHKKEQQEVQTPVLPLWAARPGVTRRQDRGAPLPSACRGVFLHTVTPAYKDTHESVSSPSPYGAFGILEARGGFASQSIPDLIDLGEM